MAAPPHYSRWRDRWKIRDLLADERCSRTSTVLDLLTSTDVGRRVPATEEDTVSEVSEAELRGWRLSSWVPRGGELPLFLPTPDFMASAGEE